jgi:sugar/nucleoside kinase (ribokinase family)
MKKTLLIADAELDFCMQVPRLPRGNEDAVRPTSSSVRIGGFGWYAAQVYHLLNFPVDWLGSIGSGQYGDQAAAAIEAAGLPVPGRTEETAGCTWTLVDPQGQVAGMSVPGAEYNVDLEALEEENPEEVRLVLLAGAMLDGDTRDDLLFALSSYAGRVVFVPGGRGVVQDVGVLETLYDLHPVLLVREEELAVLEPDCQELEKAAGTLAARTGAFTAALTEKGEIYVVQKDAEALLQTHFNFREDRSGAFETYAAGFAAGLSAGLNPITALNFADKFCLKVFQADAYSADLARQVRDLLAESILSGRSPKGSGV